MGSPSDDPALRLFLVAGLSLLASAFGGGEVSEVGDDGGVGTPSARPSFSLLVGALFGFKKFSMVSPRETSLNDLPS